MNFSDELIEKAKAAKTAEELIAMAKAENIELTSDEANEYFAILHQKSGEISDEELENVSGGTCYVDDGRPVITEGCDCEFVKCTGCGRENRRDAKYKGLDGIYQWSCACGKKLTCGNCEHCRYDHTKLLLLCNEPRNRRA